MKYKILFLSLFFLLSSSPVFAVCVGITSDGDDFCGRTHTKKEQCEDERYCKWVSNASGGTVSIDNPIETDSPEKLIGNIINAVLGISGSLALLMFIYGGFTWMLSGGNAEKVTKGKWTMGQVYV